MMEKLRIFFIEAWVWANPALYRSAVKAEGLIYFFAVQAAVAQYFSRKQEDRNLVAVARPRLELPANVDDIDGDPFCRRQSLQLAHHLLPQAPPGPRPPHDPLPANHEEPRPPSSFSPS